MPSLKMPEYGQHLVFIGATGSGKSQLAQEMLKHYDKYFAIDTQDSLELDDVKVINSPRNLSLILKWFDRVQYVPNGEYLEKNVFNYIFKKLLESSSKRKPNPRIIYIDEIYHVGYGISFPQWLPKAITTARQRAVSFWICSQRPRSIPMPVMSEASKIVVFFLSKADDAKAIAEYAREDPKSLYQALVKQKKDYSFIVIDNHTGTWEKFPPLKITE